MPRLSDTMERGTIARWLVHEGDAVNEGDVLAEIETDKATMELSAYDDGVLLRILVQDGESAELGAPIAVVGAPGEDASGFSAAPRCGGRRGGGAEAEAAGGTAATAVAAPAAPRRAGPATSRRARSHAASPPTPASTCASWPARAAAPTAASCASTSSARWPAARRGRGGRAAAPAAAARGGRARARAQRAPPAPEGGTDHRAEPDAARRRPPHERVQVPGAALLPAVRDRHGQGARAARGAQRRARRRRASSSRSTT